MNRTIHESTQYYIDLYEACLQMATRQLLSYQTAGNLEQVKYWQGREAEYTAIVDLLKRTQAS